MTKCFSVLFVSLLLSQTAFARDIYFFETESVKLSVNHNNKRNVYIFDESNSNRKHIYRAPKGFVAKTRTFGFGSGHRRGDLLWNTGFPDSPALPNILSELEWNDIDMVQFDVDGEVRFNNRFRAGLNIGIGVIYNGVGRDSDYTLDDRQGEFSRSVFEVDGDDTIDGSVYIGYEFPIEIIKNKKILFTPLLGYSYHEQNIQFEDAVQVVAGSAFGVTTPPLGPFSGLDSEYKTNWYGPWLGFETEYNTSNWTFIANYSHHWADYDAQARWNLRADFAQPISFIHEAEAEGDRFSLTFLRDWRDDWQAYLNMGIEQWKTESGLTRIFFANGTSSEAVRLNEAIWDSWWAGLGMTRTF